MYDIYEDLPFGVIILNETNLDIEYLNKKFIHDFNMDKDKDYKNISDIKCLGIINNILLKCCTHKLCKNLKKININNKYFDFSINYKKDILEVFIYEITDYVNKEIKVREDSEKFLGISTEIKAKYDIIKNIRDIERQYLINLKDIINNISEGIVVLDKNKKFNFCNKSSLNITGLTLEEIKSIKEIIKYVEVVNYKEYGNDFEEVLNYFLKNSIELRNAVVKIRDDNNKCKCKYIMVNCDYIRNDKNRLVYIVISIKDITEIKLNEIMIKKQNLELERVTRMKDEFLNMISHELRTPLTVIYSSLQLANDIYDKEITPNIKKVLSRVNQNCSRLLKLINNTLDISKAESGFLELDYSDFDIIYVTENIVSSVNLYAKSKGIMLIFDTNIEECCVGLDKDKYEKIILNLLSNAIKFTPSGKNIWIIINIKQDKVSISIKDEGIGIDPDKIDKVFDRFSQINNSLCRGVQGTGLGLALVKKFVDIMDGEILVKSEKGKGTEFNVLFKGEILKGHLQIDCFEYEDNINDKVDIEFSDIIEQDT
ncbi:PAS domain-containing sensor histidine kinase [Clostridium sp. MB40-C1]|uniref:sensor histidine kinase n=1 Tax=Clostridium sp. MB40-C1 TaxID=3070996 RepID=UPI0027E0A4AF|nr:PAS domain-containing sensor histidine kinase [Clostridium sp. MB40-C1]WMJ82160.1 PAS domain-containing sensor histidine kinase [Clostridium sp. MB40-C1]